MNLSVKTIWKHKNWLFDQGFVVPIYKTDFFDRGPNAKFIETTEVNALVNPNGMTVNSLLIPSSADPNRMILIEQETLRAHLKGRMIYVVEKVGDQEIITYKPRDRPEESQPITFLEPKPYNPTNNNQFTKGRLRLPGKPWDCAVELHSTTRKNTFSIWPPSVHLTRDDLQANPDGEHYPQQFFKEDVFEVLNFLEKWAGWKFKKANGRPIGVMKGQVEYGYENDLVTRSIPKGFSGVIGNEDTWVDHSPGPDEMESRKFHNSMSMMNNFDEHQQLAEQYQRIMKHLINTSNIIEDMAKQNEARIELTQLKDLQAKIEQQKQKTLSEAMYR